MQENERFFLERLLDGTISVNAEGHVLRHKWPPHLPTPKGGVLRLMGSCPKYQSYRAISLSVDGNSQKILMHRLVWIANFGPIPEGAAVIFHDKNRDNFWPGNLRLHRDWQHGMPLENSGEKGVPVHLTKEMLAPPPAKAKPMPPPGPMPIVPHFLMGSPSSILADQARKDAPKAPTAPAITPLSPDALSGVIDAARSLQGNVDSIAKSIFADRQAAIDAIETERKAAALALAAVEARQVAARQALNKDMVRYAVGLWDQVTGGVPFTTEDLATMMKKRVSSVPMAVEALSEDLLLLQGTVVTCLDPSDRAGSSIWVKR